MTDVAARPTRNEAPLWAPGLTLGAAGAGLMAGPSLFPKNAMLQRVGVGTAAVLGLGVGVGTQGIARGLDRVLPGDRMTAELSMAGAGTAVAAGVALLAREPQSGPLGIAKSAGMLLAAGGGAGALSSFVAQSDASIPGNDVYAHLAVAATIGGAIHGVQARSARIADIPTNSQLPKLPGFDTDASTFGQLATKREKWAPVAIASGGEGSVLPWDQLPDAGKNFLTRRPDAAEIAAVSGRTVDREPIRVYGALDHVDDAQLERLGFTVPATGTTDEFAMVQARAKLIGEEMERLGVFGRFEKAADGSVTMIEWPRANIMAVAPTSTGFVNPVAASSFEFQNADSVVVTSQVSRKKAAMEMSKIARSTAQHQAVLEEISGRIKAIPEADGVVRPRLVSYGESFGAWSAQNGLSGADGNQLHWLAQKVGKWNGPRGYAPDGLERMDALGVDRALYVGTPYTSPLRPKLLADPAMTGGDKPRVLNIRDVTEANAITAEQAEHARISFYQHDADPVGLFSRWLFFRDAPFLGPQGTRGQGISKHQRSIPLVTGLQTALDQQNAQSFTKGVLEEKGHDYRSGVALVMRRAYGNADVTLEQVRRGNEWNRQLEALAGP